MRAMYHSLSSLSLALISLSSVFISYLYLSIFLSFPLQLLRGFLPFFSESAGGWAKKFLLSSSKPAGHFFFLSPDAFALGGL